MGKPTLNHFFNLLAALMLLSLLTQCQKTTPPKEVSLPYVSSSEIASNRIIYLAQNHSVKEAFQEYQTQVKNTQHNLETLRQLAWIVIDKQSKHPQIERQILSLYGSSLSGDKRALNQIHQYLREGSLELQLIALRMLANTHENASYDYFIESMKSNYLGIRLESAMHLALLKHPQALQQIETLMYKVPNELKCFFPKFYHLINSQKADAILKQLFFDSDEDTRCTSIIEAADFQRDDFIEEIILLSKQLSTKQQEACSYAFGKFKDKQSIEKLQSYLNSSSVYTRLAAANALCQINQLQYKKYIVGKALQENLYAIQLLSHYPETNPYLKELCDSSNPEVRFNAAMSLLEKKDPACLDIIYEALTHKSQDWDLSQRFSPGKTLWIWKISPASYHKWQRNPVEKEISLSIREKIIRDSALLPEKDFLKLMKRLLENCQNELIPTIVESLEKRASKVCLDLLKEGTDKIGNPTLRAYCHLALFRLGHESPHKHFIKEWIISHYNHEIMQLRPLLSYKKRIFSKDPHIIQVKERSRLLLQSFEAMTLLHSSEGIDLLIDGIKNGHPNNQAPLAGMLMQASL